MLTSGGMVEPHRANNEYVVRLTYQIPARNYSPEEPITQDRQSRFDQLRIGVYLREDCAGEWYDYTEELSNQALSLPIMSPVVRFAEGKILTPNSLDLVVNSFEQALGDVNVARSSDTHQVLKLPPNKLWDALSYLTEHTYDQN